MARAELEDAGLRRLGLVSNPFAVPDDGSSDPAGVRLSVQAAALRLLTALNRAADDPDHRPVFVKKADIPASYHIRPLARVLADLSADPYGMELFALYVPLDMLKVGRVRAVLSSAAERVAGVAPDLTLGLWTLAALREPDESLVEWGFLSDIADVDALLAEFEADPALAAQRVFGPVAESREGAEDLEMLMRVSFTRQDRLESDPAEGEEGLAASENPSDDPMLEVFATPLVESETPVLTGADEVDAPDTAKLLSDYVVAYTGANLSPVVARAIRAYSAQGTASMAQELKVTKAPTKTLVALLKLVAPRYRAAVIIYDRMEMWGAMPHELRMKIVNTFSSLRWAIKEHGLLCFLAVPGTAPEVEETFAGAVPVAWDYSDIESARAEDAVVNHALMLDWVRSATLEGEVPVWAEELVNAVPDGVQLAVATAALSNIIDEAASRGETPAPSDVPTALERAQEAPAT